MEEENKSEGKKKKVSFFFKWNKKNQSKVYCMKSICYSFNTLASAK